MRTLKNGVKSLRHLALKRAVIFSVCFRYRVILLALFSAVAWFPLMPFETVLLPCVFFSELRIWSVYLGTLLERHNFPAGFWWTLFSLYTDTASVHCTVVNCCRWLSASARVLHSCFLIFANSMNLWLRRWMRCSVYVPKHLTMWPFLKN